MDMKKIFKHLFMVVCLLTMIIPTTAAQDNTTWEKALTITPGEDVITTFVPNSIETLWYKLEVKAGTCYEIPFPPYSYSLYRGPAEGSSDLRPERYSYNDSYINFRAIQYQSQASGVLYIECRYVAAIGKTIKWNIIEVTDNRVYNNAEAITAGQTATVPAGQLNRWYKVSLQAGTYYHLTGGDIEGCAVLDGPEGNILARKGQVFKAGQSGDYYIWATLSQTASETPDKQPFVKISEITLPENNSQAKALELTLDKEVSYSHIMGNALYFTADLVAGKTYELVAGSTSQFDMEMIEITNANLESQKTEKTYNAGLMANTIVAKATGTYHVTCISYYDKQQLYGLTLKEMNDRRLCANAVTITEGTTTTYNHLTLSDLWWKIEMKAGSRYYFNLENHDYSVLSLYADCGTEQPLADDIKGKDFSPTTDGMYYLKSHVEHPPYNGIEDNSLTVGRYDKQDNTTADKAKVVNIGEFIMTSFSDGKNLWYKVSLKGGHIYELYTQKTSDYIYIYEAGHEDGDVIQSGWGTSGIFLAPEKDGIYSIQHTFQNDSQPFFWSINEVNDNRVRQYAVSIDMDKDIDTPDKPFHSNNRYWYKFNAKADTFYEFDLSKAYNGGTWYSANDMLAIYLGDETTEKTRFIRSKQLFHSEKDQVIYLELNYNAEASKYAWRVNVMPDGDNRLCNFATQVKLNEEITPPHNTSCYETLWYTVNLEEGQVYEVTNNTSHEISIFKDGICSTNNENAALKKISGQKQAALLIEETGLYYIKSCLNFLNTNNSDDSFVIKNAEGDNRLCEFATVLKLGEETGVDHSNTTERWYKLNVTENELYEIDVLDDYANNYTIQVYENCGITDYMTMHYGTQPFTVKAKNNGTYYIKCSYNNSMKIRFVVNAVTDNRSCLYPQKAQPYQIMSNTELDPSGRWFALELKQDSIYEFDLTALSQIKFAILTSCGDEQPLTEGTNEKLLFKAQETATYLAHLYNPNYYGSNWQWSYQRVETGDSRLCEHAMKTSEQPMMLKAANGVRRWWYTVDVKADKFYQIGWNRSMSAAIYEGCDQRKPILTLSGPSKTLRPTEDTTYYILLKCNTTEENIEWFVKEVQPDGRFCDHPLIIPLDKPITVTTDLLNFNDWRETGEAWYEFVPETSGTYEIRMDFITPNEENNWYEAKYYWSIHVFNNCSQEYGITRCGHFSNNATQRVSLLANQVYKFVVWVFSWSVGTDQEWRLVKVSDEVEKGTLQVSLQQENGSSMNNDRAVVLAYKKDTDAITVADTLTYSKKGYYESKPLEYGKYIIYAENLGNTPDGRHYLPTWYNLAGIWENATEVRLMSNTRVVGFTPAIMPKSISEGNVKLSGMVFQVTSEGKKGLVSVGISIFAPKSSAPQTPQAAKGVWRADNTTEWVLVGKATTNEFGQYELTDLPAGNYKLMVDLPGYKSADGGIVINTMEGEQNLSYNFEANSETMTVSGVPTGIKEIDVSTVRLWPSPFTHEVVVSNAKGAVLKVYSATGICVHTQPITLDQETLNLQRLPAGVYVFRIDMDGKTVTRTVIKR